MKSHARSGFTVLDTMLATAILTVLLAAFGSTVTSMVRSRQNLDTTARLHEQGAEALRTIIADLRRSGRVSVGGLDYPFLFTDGVAADPDFAIHDHVPAQNEARPIDWDFGPNREIVLLAPADADFDGRPDIDVGGRLVWDPTEISYVVVTDANGVNQLQRRLNGGTPRQIVSNVERIVFDDFATSGFQVPLGAIRVQVWFRAEDATGLTHKYRVDVTVRLANGV